MRLAHQTAPMTKSKPAPRVPSPFYFWFVRDDYAEKFRVGRSDGANDMFDMMTTEEFEQLKATAARLSIAVRDLSDED